MATMAEETVAGMVALGAVQVQKHHLVLGEGRETHGVLNTTTCSRDPYQYRLLCNLNSE